MRFPAFLLATAFSLTASIASAECEIWHFEDTSSGMQKRARIFASSDLETRDALVGEAFGIAQRVADTHSLDFIDIFLTRPEDGYERSDHNASTSTVWLRYNPGRTQLIDGELVADALDDGAAVEMEYHMLMGSRSKLDASDVRKAIEVAADDLSGRCQRS